MGLTINIVEMKIHIGGEVFDIEELDISHDYRRMTVCDVERIDIEDAGYIKIPTGKDSPLRKHFSIEDEGVRFCVEIFIDGSTEPVRFEIAGRPVENTDQRIAVAYDRKRRVNSVEDCKKAG